jgi:radical SAM superfamily enzyme YgiQ (UPF0313 family)
VSKKSVLLISANIEISPAPVYPLGIARLAGALEQAGHLVRQFDVLVHESGLLCEILTKDRPDLIGVSVRNVDNINSLEPKTYINEYKQIIEQLRAYSSAPIVIGGSGFSLFPRQFMNILNADFGIVGPGENALLALLHATSSADISHIPNLLARDSENVLSVETPALTLLKHESDIIDFYWHAGGMIGVQTKRGCLKKCSYCTYPLIDGRFMQWMEPSKVVDDIERLSVERGIKYFFVTDSLFNASAEREQEFAEEICRRSLKISWGAFFSPSRIEKDYLEVLKRSGLTHMEFGTDSLCDQMLVSYRKDFTVADVHRISSLCTQMGLYVAHYIMFGGPGETAETISQTMHNTHYCDRCVFFPFPGIRIYPGTELYRRAVEEGIISPEDDCVKPKFYFAKPLNAEMIWRIIKKNLTDSRRWLLPEKQDKVNILMSQLRKRGKKGPLWEYMLV